MSKNFHRVVKRDRERAVERKRTLKRERKQAAAAAARAAENGESVGPEPGENEDGSAPDTQGQSTALNDQ
jgi:hypothetical protein